MKYEVVQLCDRFDYLKGIGSGACLTAYVPDNSPEIEAERKRQSILVCPGGGYAMTSDREAESVALAFVGAGYNAFVLRYSCAPVRYPTQLLEASAAMALIRQNALIWHVNTDQIAVFGCSAGGHLAACLGTLWDEPFIADQLRIPVGQNKPNGMILCYPVISYLHVDSFENLLGEQLDSKMIEKLSLENRVTQNTPPAFIWHTVDDHDVPVENSLLFGAALSKHHIPFEMHLFPQGSHGLSLCNQITANKQNPALINPHCQVWLPLCLRWIADYLV